MNQNRSKTRGSRRTDPRARKRFLQLAAVAFALGSQTLAARAEDAPNLPRGAALSPEGADANDRFLHRITLAPGNDGARDPARIEVIALGRADAFALDVAGGCCIGPLAPGPYVVRLTQGRQKDTHLLRVDGGTGHALIVVG